MSGRFARITATLSVLIAVGVAGCGESTAPPENVDGPTTGTEPGVYVCDCPELDRTPMRSGTYRVATGEDAPDRLVLDEKPGFHPWAVTDIHLESFRLKLYREAGTAVVRYERGPEPVTVIETYAIASTRMVRW